jgi:ABC-type nickel/cobalt efflux system permease component RcnA
MLGRLSKEEHLLPNPRTMPPNPRTTPPNPRTTIPNLHDGRKGQIPKRWPLIYTYKSQPFGHMHTHTHTHACTHAHAHINLKASEKGLFSQFENGDSWPETSDY